MLKGESIICFSSKDWVGYSRTSKEYLMEIFSRTNRVLYIETTGSRTAAVHRNHFFRIWRRLLRWLKGPRRPESLSASCELYIYAPLTIPILSAGWMHQFNLWFLELQLKILMKRLRFDRPILWYYLPTASGLIGRMNEKKVIYHVVDEWSSYPGFRGGVLEQSERHLLGRADLVVASNRELLERKKPFNSKIHYLPHGVNPEDFDKKFPPGKLPPADIETLKKPVLAMIGGVSEWVDWEILIHLAKNRPEWSILLIGDIGYDADLSRVKELRNIHLLGPRPYASLADYYQAVDLCIVSFRLTDHIKYCCPTRFFEHLAAGKPIVSTDFPAAREFGEEFVKVAKTPEEFEAKAAELLAQPDRDEVIQKRKQRARANSWLSRAEKISEWIEKERL